MQIQQLNIYQSILPQIRISIYLFLQIKQICQLRSLNNSIRKQLSDKKFLYKLLSQYFNFKQLNSQYSIQIQTLITQLNQNKIVKELPFWGYITDSGVYQNNLKYWIGKTFTKSYSPRVILSKKNNFPKIIGQLSNNVIRFKQSIIRMNKYVLHNVDYTMWNQCIPSIRNKMSQININQIFSVAFNLYYVFQFINQEIQQQFLNICSLLWEYVQNMHKIIQQAFAVNSLQLKVPHDRLQGMACVIQIEVSIKSSLNYPARSFLLKSISQENYVLNLNKKYKIKRASFQISQKNRFFSINDLQKQQGFKWVIFQQKIIYNRRQKMMYLRLQPEQRFWTNKVELTLLSYSQNNFQSHIQSGIGLSYFRLKGTIL